MRGLRTQENTEFISYFKLIQDEAAKMNAVFFADCGLGVVQMIDDIECEDMAGWLIPIEMINQFEPLFIANSQEQHNYDDYYVNVDYEIDDKNIVIVIE